MRRLIQLQALRYATIAGIQPFPARLEDGGLVCGRGVAAACPVVVALAKTMTWWPRGRRCEAPLALVGFGNAP